MGVRFVEATREGHTQWSDNTHTNHEGKVRFNKNPPVDTETRTHTRRHSAASRLSASMRSATASAKQEDVAGSCQPTPTKDLQLQLNNTTVCA